MIAAVHFTEVISQSWSKLRSTAAAGMGDVITTKQRNIEELGFPEELHGQADGAFLDLPGPWHVRHLLFLACHSCRLHLLYVIPVLQMPIEGKFGVWLTVFTVQPMSPPLISLLPCSCP